MTNKLKYISFFVQKKKNGDDVSQNLLCELGIKCLRKEKRDVCVCVCEANRY